MAALPILFSGSSFGYFSFKKSNTRLPRIPDKLQFINKAELCSAFDLLNMQAMTKAACAPFILLRSFAVKGKKAYGSNTGKGRNS